MRFNDSYTQGLKKKIASLLLALFKLSGAQLTISLSGKNEFISNSLISSMGNSYGITQIPSLTSKETAVLFLVSPLSAGGEGDTCFRMLILLCHGGNFRRT